MSSETKASWRVERREMSTSETNHNENNGNMIAADQDKDLPLWQAIKKNRIISMYTAGLTLGILLWGYDLVIVGTVASIPAFQQVFGKPYDDRLIIPASWYAIWAISTNIGLMAGAIGTGWFQDRAGRKWTLAISSVICSIAVAICYVADLPTSINARRGVFFLAKTIQGFAVGGIMCTTQTWLSETLPTALRGPFMAVFPIFKLVGQLVGALVCFSVIDSESRMSYRLCFATQWPFSVLLTLVALLLPESPAWLLRKGNDSAALQAMIRLTGRRNNDAEAALCTLRDTIETEKTGASVSKESYASCIKQPHLRRTLIVAFAEFIPLLFGLQLLGSASYFLQQIGMDSSTSVLVQVIGIAVGVLASCATFYSLSKFGRRTLTLLGMSMITLIWAGVGFSGIWQNTGAIWATAIGMLLVIFFAGIGPWPASYAFASEASAIRLRSKTQGIGWFSYGVGTMVFGIVMPYLYNPDAANLGSFTAFFYFGLAGLGTVVIFFCMPEMKGRTPKEIDTMFDLRVPARKFKHWRAEGGDEELSASV